MIRILRASTHILPLLLFLLVSTGYGLTLKGTYTTPGSASKVKVKDNQAYIITSDSGIILLDISNPVTPVRSSKIHIPGVTFSALQIAGNRLYASSSMAQLHIYDVSNPSSPNSIDTFIGPEQLRNAWDIAVKDSSVYTLIGSGTAFRCREGQPADSVLTFQPTLAEGTGLAVQGDRLWLANLGGIEAFALFQPDYPFFLNALEITDLGAIRITIQGNSAYLACWNNGIGMVDLTDQDNPAFQYRYDTPGSSNAVYTAGNMVFLADGQNGVLVFTPVSDTLLLIDSVNTPGDAKDIAGTANLLVVADGSNGLRIYSESPRFLTLPDSLVEFGVDYTCTLRIAAMNTTNLTCEIVDNPGFFSLVAGTESSINPIIKIEGAPDMRFTLTLNCSDGFQLTQISCPIDIANRYNQPPRFSPTLDTMATAAHAYGFPIYVHDPDMRPLTLELKQAPIGMSLSFNTSERIWYGLWTPANNQIGRHKVVLYVTDDSLAQDSLIFHINVTNPNDPPAIDIAYLDTAIEDMAYRDTLKAVDLDGNRIYWYLLSGPDSLRVGLSNGVVTWTPRATHGDSALFTVRATDGVLSDTAVLTIPVRQVNDAPVITSQLPDTVIEDSLYTFTLRAFDEEGDALTWTMPANPEGASIIDTILVWVPVAGVVEPETLILIVSDSQYTDTLVKVFYRPGMIVTKEATLQFPKNLCLSACPNPFNPSLRLNVDIPISETLPVKLEIFNAAGKRVRFWQLNNPGYHQFEWNARESGQYTFSSGVYFARLTGKHVIQKKLLLLK